jgi:dipeptidyl-peptidase-4
VRAAFAWDGAIAYESTRRRLRQFQPMTTNIARVLAVPFALLAVLPAQEAAKKRLTFADARQQLEWGGALPGARVAWDGKHIEIARGKGTVWFDPATQQETQPVEPPQPAAEPQPAADAAAVTKTRFAARIHQGDLFVEPVRGDAQAGRGRRGGGRGNRGNRGAPGEDAVRLTDDGDRGGSKAEAHCNAAGTFASFVRGGDLVIVDAASKAQWEVTADGKQDRLHGQLDWVYQEEVYGRGDFQGHWWSDGDLCAVLSLDEAPVREFTIVNHVPNGYLDKERNVTTVVTNYPKVGDPNPVASLQVVDARQRRVVNVDLAAYPKDVLVVRVEWTPKQQLLVTLQDRIQTWAELCQVDCATGKLTKWIREESPTWVNRPDSPQWLQDGTFLWLSERTGYQHVYRYKPGGELVNAVTSGDWQVRRIQRVDEGQRSLWFEGTREGAMGEHVYRCGLDGKNLALLTPGVGYHAVEFVQDGRFLIDRWQAMDMPTVVRVVDGATGAVVKEIGRQPMGPAAEEYAFAPKERLSIATRDGDALDGSLMLPPDHKAGERYPIYLPTYSGPDNPTVSDRWSPNTYHQFVAQQGFIVLQVNVRTASNRGQKVIGGCYKHLGEQELADLEDAVAFVCKERQGDPARVAIEGWSYGGFMAAFALTHSDKFALGIAGAGVYDWRLYDTIYTERYMRLPDDNKDGYDRTSVIKAAKNLKGHLVLLHGTMDDNVHMQNTMQLLWELEKANKQNFELMLYPRSQHGLAPEVGAHSRDFQWRCLKRLLDPQWRPE